MRDKIRPYVSGVFEEVKNERNDAQTTTLLMDMKEELITNLEARYDDERNHGVSEAQAYADTIECMGDIHELFTINDLNDDYLPALYVNPDYAGYQMGRDEVAKLQMEEKFNEVKNNNKKLSKLIDGPLALLIFSAYFYLSFNGFWPWRTSWILLLSFWGLEGLSKTLCGLRLLPYSRFSEEEHTKQKKRIRHGLNDLYWCLILVVYFLYSFQTGAWATSWLIFILAPILPIILATVFGKAGDDDRDENENDGDVRFYGSLLSGTPQQVQKIEITSVSGSIKVKESTNGQFQLSNCSAKYTNDGKAVFKTNGSGTIGIPDTYHGAIMVKTTSGNIEFTPATALAASDLVLKTVSGSIRAGNLSMPCKIKSVSGSVYADYHSVHGASKIEAVSGSVSVSCPPRENYIVNAGSNVGNVSTFGPGYYENQTAPLAGKMDISTVSGSVSVSLK